MLSINCLKIQILADIERIKNDNKNDDLIKVSILVDTLSLRFTISLLQFFFNLNCSLLESRELSKAQISNFKYSVIIFYCIKAKSLGWGHIVLEGRVRQ